MKRKRWSTRRCFNRAGSNFYKYVKEAKMKTKGLSLLLTILIMLTSATLASPAQFNDTDETEYSDVGLFQKPVRDAIGEVDGNYQAQYAVVIGKANAAFYQEPSANGEILGSYPPGTRVEIEASNDQWCGVVIGEADVGFIKRENLSFTSEKRIPFRGMPEIGYVVVNGSGLDIDQEMLIYRFPDLESDVIDFNGLPTTGSTMALLADLGEWRQIRGSTDRHVGFVLSSQVDKYPMEKLIVGHFNESFESGAYDVGNDMPSGFYTFMTPTQSGTRLEISGTGSTHDRIYDIWPDMHYTLFLPENATVHISGDGSLTAMETHPIVGEDAGWTYYGNGGFFMATEFQSTNDRFILRLADDAEYGYYEVTTLGNVYKNDSDPWRYEMIPGEEYEFSYSDGQFIAFYNCLLEIRESHG